MKNIEVFIRFLAIGSILPRDYSSFPLPENSSAADLLAAVEEKGKAGAFCPASQWPGLSRHVLLAADERMLHAEDTLYEGQKISIIGQLIGG
jgi:hypothetical protein